MRHSNKNVAHIPRFLQTKTEGQLDKEKIVCPANASAKLY